MSEETPSNITPLPQPIEGQIQPAPEPQAPPQEEEMPPVPKIIQEAAESFANQQILVARDVCKTLSPQAIELIHHLSWNLAASLLGELPVLFDDLKDDPEVQAFWKHATQKAYEYRKAQAAEQAIAEQIDKAAEDASRKQ